MVKSAENRMRSNLELLPVINVKSRPHYISALKKSRSRYISAKKISTLFCKHVLWLLISCLTDCLCNLGSKYNDRICPGFINSKFAKVICSRSVALSLIGGIRGIPLKNIAYNLVIADSYQI
jgi:hypothetical protein